MTVNLTNLLCKVATLVVASLCLQTTVAQVNKTRPLGIDAAATIGAYAVDLGTGQTIWAYNEDLWLTPASLTKVLTTGAALQTKGPNARLHTKVELTTVGQGLHSLRIVGEFDPTMNSSYFDKAKMTTDAKALAIKLKAKGISRIEAVCVDDSRECADALNPKILWEDMGNYYGAPPTIVSYMDNSASLYFSTPAGLGKDCTLDSVVPALNGLTVTTDVLTHSLTTDKCQVRWLGADTWHATGSLPQSRKAFRVKSVMPRPTLRYAEALADALRAEGIEVGTATTGESEAGETIMTIESPNLSEIIKVTNHESVNLFADALAMNLALGRKATGRLEWADAASAVMSFWKERYGLEMRLDDGSGLSPQGAVSAKTMVKAIAAMRKSTVWDAYRESLPIVGKTGTVSSLGGKLAVSGHARAKSGTMSGVVAYAGVMKTTKGREVAFCIIVNHHKEGVWVVRGKVAEWLNMIYNDKK